MPSTRTQPGSTPQELERFRSAKRLALDWMQAVGANFRGLAQRVGEPPCYISRFFHPAERHAPCARRPAMQRVLEKVERHCAVPNDVVELPLEDYRVDEDDAVLVARNQMYRLRALRNELDPAQALVYAAEPCQIAIHAEASQRAAMCTNVLLTLATLLMNEGARRASRELLERTIDRLTRLENSMLESVADASDEFSPEKAIGYAGAARAWAGVLLADRALVQLGAQRMLRAATTPHPPKDQLWHNLLGFVEHLLENDHPDAGSLARQAITRGSSDRSDSLRSAIRTRELPLLRAAWATSRPSDAVELFQDQ